MSQQTAAGLADIAESKPRLWMRVKTRDHQKEPLTRAREAAAVPTSHDCGGSEIKPCRIPVKVSFSLRKTQQHRLLKIEPACGVSLQADHALHEDSEAAIKTTSGMLPAAAQQEQGHTDHGSPAVL